MNVTYEKREMNDEVYHWFQKEDKSDTYGIADHLLPHSLTLKTTRMPKWVVEFLFDCEPSLYAYHGVADSKSRTTYCYDCLNRNRGEKCGCIEPSTDREIIECPELPEEEGSWSQKVSAELKKREALYPTNRLHVDHGYDEEGW